VLSNAFREQGFFFSNILILFAALSVYLAVSSWFLPTGVNNVLVTRFAKYLIPATALLFIAFFGAVYIGDNKITRS